MTALIFPIGVSLVLFVWGAIVLFSPKLGKLLLSYINRTPIRTLGLFWLLMIIGLFVSSYLAYDPIAVNLIAVILVFDALSLIFMPNYITQIITLYKKMSRTYRSVYGVLSILISSMILWQFYLPIKELAEKNGLI